MYSTWQRAGAAAANALIASAVAGSALSSLQRFNITSSTKIQYHMQRHSQIWACQSAPTQLEHIAASTVALSSLQSFSAEYNAREQS